MQSGAPLLCGVLAILVVQQSGFSRPEAVHKAHAVSCIEGARSKILLRSTYRVPKARGTLSVERKGGTTTIELELESMKPASLFGGDYNTYVLWVVPPSGGAENLGEIVLHGARAHLRVSTEAEIFAILVTAEPHSLVTAPSAFVVLENQAPSNGRTIEQPLLTGKYYFSRSSLKNTKEAEVEVHTDVRQAFTAFRLAQRAGAANLAHKELAAARNALDKTIRLWRERRDRIEIAVQARETIRLALAAQRLAQERALQGTRDPTEGVGGGNPEAEGREARDIR